MQDLCANTVVFDANRAITAAGHGGRGLRVTVPSWPCAARASTMTGEHKPRAVWGGWGSASPVVCAALMLSGVGAPGWGVSRLGQGNAWQVLLLHKRNMASGVREVCAGSVEGSCVGPQGDELSAEMHMGDLVPSCSRLGVLSVLAWLVLVSLALPIFLLVLCNMLSCCSTSMAECWGLWAGDHRQMRHQGLTEFLKGLLKLVVLCRQGGLRAYLLFSSLSVACEQYHGDGDPLIMAGAPESLQWRNRL